MIAPNRHAETDLDVGDLDQDIDAPLDERAAEVFELTLTKIDFDQMEVSLDL